MQAYVCHRYGGPEVVELGDVPTPEPQDNEVRIRIQATTVTAGDWRVRTLTMPRGFGLIARLALGFRGPRQPILGTELAGVIETTGKKVTRFKPGDAVFAFPGSKMGCHAQYRVLPEDGPLALKPERLSFEEAASLSFGASTALHFLGKAKLKAREKVLVVGASGNVGSALVQLARHFGADVTGVTSTANLELVASLGAHRVIDYTRQAYAVDGVTYDVIADTVGAASFGRYRHALNDQGRLLSIAGGLGDLVAAAWTRRAGRRRVIAGPAEERPETVGKIAELAQAGALKPVIDRRYTFAQMAEAHAYVATGRKRGSVAVVLN